MKITHKYEIADDGIQRHEIIIIVLDDAVPYVSRGNSYADAVQEAQANVEKAISALSLVAKTLQKEPYNMYLPRHILKEDA